MNATTTTIKPLLLCYCSLFTWRGGGGEGGRYSETGREEEAEDEFVCIDLLVILTLLYNYHQHNILLFS